MSKWCLVHDRESFLYEHLTTSAIFWHSMVVELFSDGLRPGSIYDANDEAQFAALRTMGGMVVTRMGQECAKAFIEAPDTFRCTRSKKIIRRQIEKCHDAPVLYTRPSENGYCSG